MLTNVNMHMVEMIVRDLLAVENAVSNSHLLHIIVGIKDRAKSGST